MTKSDRSKKPTAEEYKPTAKQQALLDIILDPYHRMASVKRQCELAKCSREFFYNTMKNPEFADYYRFMIRENIKARAGQLLNIGIREALKGGSQGFGYWKELAKMAEVIDGDKVTHEHEGEMEITVRFAPVSERDE